MWYALVVLASLYAPEAAIRSADLARELKTEWEHRTRYDADYARYRGTGESAEDLQPLTRAELEQEYRVEECDGLLWAYDRQTGGLVFLFGKDRLAD